MRISPDCLVFYLTPNNPLYVVDGIPIGADDIDFLNPGDIKDVSILKDDPALSIYGSRGSNGVVTRHFRKKPKSTA